MGKGCGGQKGTEEKRLPPWSQLIASPVAVVIAYAEDLCQWSSAVDRKSAFSTKCYVFLQKLLSIIYFCDIFFSFFPTVFIVFFSYMCVSVCMNVCQLFDE